MFLSPGHHRGNILTIATPRLHASDNVVPGPVSYDLTLLNHDALVEICTEHGVDRQGARTEEKLFERAARTTLENTTKAYNVKFCKHLGIPVNQKLDKMAVSKLLRQYLDQNPQEASQRFLNHVSTRSEQTVSNVRSKKDSSRRITYSRVMELDPPEPMVICTPEAQQTAFPPGVQQEMAPAQVMPEAQQNVFSPVVQQEKASARVVPEVNNIRIPKPSSKARKTWSPVEAAQLVKEHMVENAAITNQGSPSTGHHVFSGPKDPQTIRATPQSFFEIPMNGFCTPYFPVSGLVDGRRSSHHHKSTSESPSKAQPSSATSSARTSPTQETGTDLVLYKTALGREENRCETPNPTPASSAEKTPSSQAWNTGPSAMDIIPDPFIFSRRTPLEDMDDGQGLFGDAVTTNLWAVRRDRVFPSPAIAIHRQEMWRGITPFQNGNILFRRYDNLYMFIQLVLWDILDKHHLTHLHGSFDLVPIINRVFGVGP